MVLLSTDYKLHIPVMVKEVIELLDPSPDGVYVDATLGCAGHSMEILKKLGLNGRLIGIDRDETAIEISKDLLNDSRVILKKAKFSQLLEVLKELNIDRIDGIIFDLGVSMLQLKDFSRGFSFYSENNLDMRMDQTDSLTAWYVVNKYPEKELERILREYGDEPFARRITKEIVRQRSKKTIDTCKELAELVKRVVPRHGKLHPATQVFQALRIEVNKEIEELKAGLSQAVELLKKGGRICVISYHSGEDRIVKNFFKEKEKEGIIRVFTKKPILPSLEEVFRNPSSRSARLRGGEKL
ncbi:16S rRNA (cytosine1402-N4)-methyltransferase [Thermodesulfovibrio aggregans]|uniref:Ribosomal RNA small subunit methyltransferase H n=1 Tax=Thermodesulfovibrio aggregans TaxID=86166 RepID=A0A0U9HNW9_9BACT|nr:16S rRNA (cytosine(1402)-N(4))-methyltransferase RsmH [Thermodesulfovibrio aggregans]GAQ93890.1 16S rRNA (cytosine1402-N4)-methyltransferase [Thermodesulfovibrio aggregans]